MNIHTAINITKPKNHYFCEVAENAMKNNLAPNFKPPTFLTDYYPFGYPIAERSWTGDGYRFGFNGQEKDDEIYGEGASYTAEFWQYDSRLGRRWNVDPVLKAWESPYATFGGNPVKYIDPDGRDWYEGGNGDVVWVDESNKEMKKSVEGWKHLGESYMGFTVEMSNVQNYEAQGGGYYSQMVIRITYHDAIEGTEYAWTQVITAEPPIPPTIYGEEKGSQFVDFDQKKEDYYPLYNGAFAKDRTEFFDLTSSQRENHAFTGEVSLLERTKTDTEMSTGMVSTFKWGFSVKDGKITVNPVQVETRPSELMNKTVYEISKEE